MLSTDARMGVAMGSCWGIVSTALRVKEDPTRGDATAAVHSTNARALWKHNIYQLF